MTVPGVTVICAAAGNGKQHGAADRVGHYQGREPAERCARQYWGVVLLDAGLRRPFQPVREAASRKRLTVADAIDSAWFGKVLREAAEPSSHSENKPGKSFRVVGPNTASG